MNSRIERPRIHLPSVIGRGYSSFWHSKVRYRVLKGGRGSKKSCTTALWCIYNLMKYPEANLLVVRRYFNTHKDSTFAQLIWAINRLGAADAWGFSKNPMEIRYKPTGQKILFRGMDDPQSITSITVDKGVLCWFWIEEAFQIMNEADFNKLDTSLRGIVPEGYFKQLTLTFNPWSDKHWIKKRFFDTESDLIFADTTNFMCNEFLDEADKQVFEEMRINQPRRYQVEGLGNWGIAEGLIYDNWEEHDFKIAELLKKRPYLKTTFGLDFGYTNDPSAFIAMAVDQKAKEIYVFDEFYKKQLTNQMIAEHIINKGYRKETIIADSAEPKSIQELRDADIPHIRAARKGPDSIRHGIQHVQGYKIIVHPSCTNTVMELSNYIWDTNREGVVLNRPIDDFNHLMDAMRYALEELAKGSLFSFD
ncbi:MAG: PBSX family phage terminase large subunit [Bacillota bacterium]|jgi:phage terminase large subunit